MRLSRFVFGLLAASLPVSMGGQEYNDSVARATRVEHKYASGWALPRIGADLLALPDKPLLAEQTLSIWAWHGAPTDRPLTTSTVMLARDQYGRTRHAWPTGPNADTRVVVYDPMTHTELSYVLYQQPRKNLVAAMCTEPREKDLSNNDPGLQPTVRSTFSYSKGMSEARAMQDAAFLARPDNHHRELGVKLVNGVEATGLLTHNFEEGLNWPYHARPSQSYREQWFSAELGLQVLDASQTYGESKINTSTHNIRLVAPDPGMFELPPGYTLKATIPSCF